jgi:hypothetical protein
LADRKRKWSHGESNIDSEKSAESSEEPETPLESTTSATPEGEQPGGKEQE